VTVEPPAGEPEEVLDLTDVVEPASPAEAGQTLGALSAESPSIDELDEHLKEEEFVLDTTLKDLELELTEQFPEGEAEAPPREGVEEEEVLTLDLPAAEEERGPRVESEEDKGLFGELSLEGDEAEMESETAGFQEERVETILNESALELERIEGTTMEPEEPAQLQEPTAEEPVVLEEPVAREEPEVLEEPLPPEQPVAVPGPRVHAEEVGPQIEMEPEFEAREFRDTGLDEAVRDTLGELTDRLAGALAREVRRAVEGAIEDKMRAVVREEIDKLRNG
jgi:hypothetical protein